MGQKDETLASLERAMTSRVEVVTALKVDPLFEFLRGDPRYGELLRRLRLDAAK